MKKRLMNRSPMMAYFDVPGIDPKTQRKRSIVLAPREVKEVEDSDIAGSSQLQAAMRRKDVIEMAVSDRSSKEKEK